VTCTEKKGRRLAYFYPKENAGVTKLRKDQNVAENIRCVSGDTQILVNS